MVFTDHIRFLSPNKVPTVQLVFDPLIDRLFALSQDNQIYIYDSLAIYKWEDELRSSIEEDNYVNPLFETKPIAVIRDICYDTFISVMRFSNQTHEIKKMIPIDDPNKQKTQIKVKSKMNPDKQIKISVIEKPQPDPSEIESNVIKDYILTLGTDNGGVLMFKNTSNKQVWTKFYEFKVGEYNPITDIAWNNNDELFAVATFSLEVKIYKLELSDNSSHNLLRLIPSKASQIYQITWNPSVADMLAIYEKGTIQIVNSRSGKLLNMYKMKTKRQIVKKVNKESEEIEGIKEEKPTKQDKKDDKSDKRDKVDKEDKENKDPNKHEIESDQEKDNDSDDLTDFVDKEIQDDDDIINFVLSLKPQTSWIHNTNRIAAWNGRKP